MTTDKPIYRSSPEWKAKIGAGLTRYWSSLSIEKQQALIKKRAEASRGHTKSEEWKRKMSLRNSGKGNPNYDKKASDETRAKMSISQKANCHKSPANFANLSKSELQPILEKAHRIQAEIGISEETRAKLSLATKGENNPFYGKHHTKETKAKISKRRLELNAQGYKFGFANMSKEQLQEINRRTIAKCCARPNNTEAKLMEIIDKACPNQYRYTGDASVKIAGLYPDFLNVNGKKKVIEMFGDYYHSGEVVKAHKNWKATELGRIMLYNSYGFDCLIIWSSELNKKSKSELISTIKNFNRKKVLCPKR